MATTTKSLADAIVTERLGIPLADFIADQRDDHKSWQKIADELADRTDGIVSVSWMTIQRWSEDAA